MKKKYEPIRLLITDLSYDAIIMSSDPYSDDIFGDGDFDLGGGE